MRVPRVARILLLSLATIVVLAGLLVASVWVYFHPAVTRRDGVRYGQRRGHDLALDVLRPSKPNGGCVKTLNAEQTPRSVLT
jgi:hypothetical protein